MCSFFDPAEIQPYGLFCRFTNKLSCFPSLVLIHSCFAVINQLKDSIPGTFIVRDSNSFPGAFGLAVRVAQLPPNVQVKQSHDMSSEYVRFYLIEPTAKGVKLKGCSNEPVFGKIYDL